MKRALLTVSMLICAGTASAAQTCTTPGPAAAAGYTTQTFGGSLNLGTTPNPATSFPVIGNGINVVPDTFYGQSWKAIGMTGANGSVTMDGSGQTYGDGAATAVVTPPGQPLQGVAFGGGGYFQVTMAGNGPMSFWMNDAETMNGLSNGSGGIPSWIEADIAEFDSTNAYGFTLHNWYGTPGSGNVVNANENGASPAGADYSKPNKYGMLWVPATATTQGSAKFYFNDAQVGNTITWNQYVPGQSATANPFAVMDSLHMVPILGANPGTTVTFSDLQVWQGSNAANIGTNAGAPTSCNPDSVATASAAFATPTTALADPGAPAPANAPAPVSEPVAAVVPGQGSLTDCSGRVWTINSNTKILMDGVAVTGGGDTAQLAMEGCTVKGLSNGKNGSSTNWFSMNSTNPTESDGWTVSTAPNDSSVTASPVAALATTPKISPISDYVGVCATGTPNSPASAGGFGTIGGQFYDPSGQPWIANGVNVPDFNMGSAENSLLTLLPNTNFIRLNIYSYADPSTYQSFINWATSRGIVVEIDDHTNFPSNAFSGSQLAAETQFFSAVASAFKTNPYVWFETQNEPQAGDITTEEVAVYNAVRNAGNNNPIGMQLWGGGNAGFLGMMNTGAYTSMTNVYITPHFYAGGMSGSTLSSFLQNEIASAQQIKTADGTPPVLIDEYGDSMDGMHVDANGPAAIALVNQSGYGRAAWTFSDLGGNGADTVTNGGQSLTTMGQQIAGFMTTSAAGCAQSAVPTMTVTAPGPGATNTTVTAPALAPAATSLTAPALAANPLSISQVAALAAGGN